MYFDHSHICFIGKLSCLRVSYGVILSFSETDAMVFGTTCLFLVISVFVHSWKRPAHGMFVYIVLFIALYIPKLIVGKSLREFINNCTFKI